MDDVSTSWCESNVRAVFKDLGIDFDLCGEIDAADLLDRCRKVTCSNHFDRIFRLMEIAKFAISKGVGVCWG